MGHGKVEIRILQNEDKMNGSHVRVRHDFKLQSRKDTPFGVERRIRSGCLLTVIASHILVTYSLPHESEPPPPRNPSF